MISSLARGARPRVCVITAVLGLVVVSAIAGCTPTKSSPRPHTSSAAGRATPPPAAVPYAGSCPSAETVSTAIGKVVSLTRQTPTGGKVDCSYSGAGSSVVIGFESNAGMTPSQLLAQLNRAVGHDNLKRVPGVGQAAYEYAAKNKGIAVVAINHGFTIDILTTGLTAAAAVKAETTAVGIGGH
jgi:hypothetical protein